MFAVEFVSRTVVTLTVLVAARAAAQPVNPLPQLTERGPTFYMLMGDHPVAVDVRSVRVLQQRIALDLDSISLPAAIDIIRDSAHVDIAYNSADVPATLHVSLSAS